MRQWTAGVVAMMVLGVALGCASPPEHVAVGRWRFVDTQGELIVYPDGKCRWISGGGNEKCSWAAFDDITARFEIGDSFLDFRAEQQGEQWIGWLNEYPGADIKVVKIMAPEDES